MDGGAGDPSPAPRSMPTMIVIDRQHMYIGALTLDVLLGDVRSLKQKRSVVRPIVAEVRRRFPAVAVAETGHLDLHRRAEIGIAVVSATAGNCGEVMDACERLVAYHPEIELLSARRRIFNEHEDSGHADAEESWPGSPR